MLNDIREPPLEPKPRGRHSTPTGRRILKHPILSPNGDPVADVELFNHSIPDHAVTSAVASSLAVVATAVLLLAMLWVWAG